MMHLAVIPSTHVDQAWRDGGSCLSKACDASGGEITGDQLKLILARGERTLLALVDDDKPVGWAVVRIDQLPNMRVYFVTDLVAPHARFERFMDAAKEMAASLGCSRIRCAAKPAQERLYRMKLKFQPVYNILEVAL